MSKIENKMKESNKFQVPKSKFIDYLENLKKIENRGALASLRRGLQHDVGTCIDMYKYIIPWTKNMGEWERNIHYLVASLFAYHPSSTSTGHMGDVFHIISQKRGSNNSLELRFVTLLRSNPEDLPIHLRQAISIAKSESIPINWHELLYDLKRWPYESKYPPYEKWANSFWKRDIKQNNKKEKK